MHVRLGKSNLNSEPIKAHHHSLQSLTGLVPGSGMVWIAGAGRKLDQDC